MITHIIGIILCYALHRVTKCITKSIISKSDQMIENILYTTLNKIIEKSNVTQQKQTDECMNMSVVSL